MDFVEGHAPFGFVNLIDSHFILFSISKADAGAGWSVLDSKTSFKGSSFELAWPTRSDDSVLFAVRTPCPSAYLSQFELPTNLNVESMHRRSHSERIVCYECRPSSSTVVRPALCILVDYPHPKQKQSLRLEPRIEAPFQQSCFGINNNLS